MYQIRGLKSSMDKVAYPGGKVTSIGSVMEDTSFKFQPSSEGSYSSNILFARETNHPHAFEIEADDIYSRGVNGESYYKSVAVQKQISNNGSLLPHNTNDRYLGPITWAGWGGNYYLNQKFKLNRNAVPFSPVNELLVMQVKLKNKIITTPLSVGTHVDYRFNENGIGDIINIPPRVKVGNNPLGIASSDTYDFHFNVKNKTGDLLFSSKTTYDSINTSYSQFNVNNNTDTSYKYVDLAISAENINKHIADMYTIEFSYAGRLGNCVFDIDDALKAVLVKGAAKYKYVFFKMLITTSRGYLDESNKPAAPQKREALKATWRHQSDFLPESTVVDPLGEYIILKFNRPTRVDVFFENTGLSYDVVSDANNEIRVNKKGTKFTVGGVLTVTQKHDFVPNTLTNRTFTYTVPDTTPPDAPTYTGATRTTVSGTAKAGDVVVIEKDNVIIGQGTATATNTFEITIQTVELQNDDVIVIYTKDKAGNKSTYVNATITDISSENKIDMLINSDIYNTI